MKLNLFRKLIVYVVIYIFSATLVSCTQNDKSVEEVMDETISHLYKTMDAKELSGLDYDKVLSLFSRNEKKILSTRYWTFNINVPAVVSVMRSKEQEIVPFWLSTCGFIKTDMVMKNEQTIYEVWQKTFNAGTVRLGINGFENYSLHYFVSVAPQNKNDQLELSSFFPENQYVGVLEDSAFTYHDWDELVLRDVPEAIKGQKLLTTVRGCGVETHLIGAFRATDYPSSQNPDQIMLSWSSDPETSIDIQWRTDTTIANGLVKFREKGSPQESSVYASKYRMEDRVLMNDRYVNRFTAQLRNLKTATTYEYQVVPQSEWVDNQVFTTQVDDDRFSFIWFGDTHHSPKFGELINVAEKRHPEVAFYSIAGDIVSDGLHRDQWDDLFGFTKEVICRKPLMVVPGNHDNRAGLGALMYRELFSYPKNGPQGVEKEQTYSFKYKNTLFLMIDATSPIDAQSSWIEEQLSISDATWKFAMFHFPPYSDEGGYPDIRNKWCTLFDKYHVDMVMSGHVHYYLRTTPINKEKPVDLPADGTIYLISIGIPDNDQIDKQSFADAQVSGEMLYQALDISGNKLVYRAMNIEGVVRDEMVITK